VIRNVQFAEDHKYCLNPGDIVSSDARLEHLTLPTRTTPRMA
jgi:hypothetical protein